MGMFFGACTIYLKVELLSAVQKSSSWESKSKSKDQFYSRYCIGGTVALTFVTVVTFVTLPCRGGKLSTPYDQEVESNMVG